MSNNHEWYHRKSDDDNKKEKVKAFKDYRSQYMRDEGRVVHSFAFRRLQGKTQVLGIEQGDYHRNRLTHSLEVASIARSVAKYIYTAFKENKTTGGNSAEDDWKKDDIIQKECSNLLECQELMGDENKSLKEYDHLISTISLLHDIGHPPFGHAGEEALNFKMYNYGGFEGNAQTLRLVTDLEDYCEKYGLDLTRRSLLGLIKYPNTYKNLVGELKNKKPSKNRLMVIEEWKPPKCIYYENENILDWILNVFSLADLTKFKKSTFKKEKSYPNHKVTVFKSFDCSIMDIADDISYSAHDLEDAIFMELIKKDDLIEDKWVIVSDYFQKRYKGGKWHEDMCNKNNQIKKRAFSHMVGELVKNIKVKKMGFEDPLLNYNAKFKSEASYIVDKVKELIAEKAHQTQEIQTIVFGGMITVTQLFDVLYSNRAKLLPNEYKDKLTGSDKIRNMRVVCDYIASMTDEYARRLHERIYCDLPGSVFLKL